MAKGCVVLLAIGIATAHAVRPDGDDDASAMSAKKAAERRSASLLDISANGSAETHSEASPGLAGAEEALARDADRLSLTSGIFEEALDHAAKLVDMVTQVVAGNRSNNDAEAVEMISAPSSLLSSQERGGAAEAKCELPAQTDNDKKKAPGNMMEALRDCVSHLEELSEKTKASADASHKANIEYVDKLTKADGNLRTLEKEQLKEKYETDHKKAYCALHEKLCQIKEGYNALNGMKSQTIDECKKEKDCSAGATQGDGGKADEEANKPDEDANK